MKKQTLQLSRETLRLITPKEAKEVQGGIISYAPTKDPRKCNYKP